MKEAVKAEDHYLEEFRRRSDTLPGPRNVRREAIESFEALGFPTRRMEQWRFTDVTPLKRIPFRPPDKEPRIGALGGVARGPLKDSQLAFVDGFPAPEFSYIDLPKGVTAARLSSVLAKDRERLEPHLGRRAAFDEHAFAALNTAFMTEGAFVHVPRGTVMETPIHLLFLSSSRDEPFVTHPRVLVVLEPGAQATVVECYIGPQGGVYFTNAVTEISLGENAVLEHVKVQRESQEAFHISMTRVHQERGSNFRSHSVSFGSLLSRNDLGCALDGEGAECGLDGLYEVTGRQLADNHTTIDHVKPHTTSNELYKGILDGPSRGVFDGRIIVRPDAQKSVANQVNNNLLLSQDALVDTKPQLEIFADDVKCRHGATVGKLDRDMLFYLRSRGIDREQARRILIHAFAGEIVDRVPSDAVKTQIGGCLRLMVMVSGT